MMKKSAVIFLWSMFAACSAGEPLSPIYEGKPSAAEREQAKQDYRLFVDHCPILFAHYMEDIDAVEIWASSTFSPMGAPATYIKVRIKGNTQHIPSEYRAWGHTLHYYILRDGISTIKDQSYQVCGWPLTMSETDLVHSFDTLATVIASTPDHYITNTIHTVKEGNPKIGCIPGSLEQLTEWKIDKIVGLEKMMDIAKILGWCEFLQPGESVLVREWNTTRGTAKVVRLREYWVEEEILNITNTDYTVKEGNPKIGCIPGSLEQLTEWEIDKIVSLEKTMDIAKILGWCEFLQSGESVLVREWNTTRGTAKVVRLREYWVEEEILKPADH